MLISCSTTRNNFISRNSHALSTKYNILYNGGIALDKGIYDLKSKYKDNYWEILPVERMQVLQDQNPTRITKNANFDRAEEKATKAIQKHSMNIDGSEKNFQIDEAHLMLGKARYYDQRFVPALEAFNYVLYKYPKSDKIYEVKIWREKTNMRLDNDALAVSNLNTLLVEIKFKDQIFADANATLAQAYLNLLNKSKAIAKLKLATQFTNQDEEKARYRFILGQLYEDLGKKDSAYAFYQQIIDMNRKASRIYVMQSHARQAAQFDFAKGDTIVFLKKFNELLKDRENRPFLDILNHQMGLFYDKNKKFEIAKKYYNASLKNKKEDEYLEATNYKNLAAIYFNKAKYVTAGKYYDSVLSKLNSRGREFRLFTKKRENLDDVIKFENIAQQNDSILSIASLPKTGQEAYYQKFIDKLKIADDKALKAKILADKLASAKGNNQGISDFKAPSNLIQQEASQTSSRSNAPVPSTNFVASQSSDFYFYNPSTVAYGKLEFKKIWGDRSYIENWRLSSKKETFSDDPVAQKNSNFDDIKETKLDEKYTTIFYIKNIPTNQKVLDSLNKDRNFAYFQLGTIYKEKFKEYQLAADKLEKLLVQNPEERLVLPSMYNLYKIYEIINPEKALAMKENIIAKYPNSRYTQILTNSIPTSTLNSKPEEAYDTLYKDYQNGLLRETLPALETAIEQFDGEQMEPKFELLKANTIGKLKGLTEFKKALNYVSLSYPNSFEGKETEMYIATKIPYLEALSFTKDIPSSWKIIFPINFPEEQTVKPLLDKITKFAKERSIEKLFVSNDIYLLDKNFLVIHGIKTEESAKGIATVLKEYKEYKIKDQLIVISTQNYKVLQIKKNLEEFESGKWITNILKEPIQHPKSEVVKDVISNKNIKSGTEITPKNDIPPAIQKLMEQENLKNKGQNAPILDPMQSDDVPQKK